MLHCLTKGVSVDVSYFLINDILEYNLPYVQSRSDGVDRQAQWSTLIVSYFDCHGFESCQDRVIR